MVITKHFLADKMGIDFEIATYFADRRVPENNNYWGKRPLYLRFGTGFLFLPVIYDLLYKSGLEKSLVIDEARVVRMEESFAIVTEYESEQISFEQYTNKMADLYRPVVVNQQMFDDLLSHFRNEQTKVYKFGSGVPALDRADAFLLNFVDLTTDEDFMKTLITRWYHIAVAVLMLDDLVDIDKDRGNADENALLQLGDNSAAVNKCTFIIEQHLDALALINPKAAGFFRKVLDHAMQEDAVKLMKTRD
ncbi:MAG: hypothetical protein EOO04_32195 [Chitinophagaceae bacterium]|nr:MAG: hypothetical protein EOO04_32195 [Chitinophagaceae bacterium]